MRTIRYENVALLTMAAIFSVVATVVLSGFLEPSQPPAVAAVEIGEPRDGQESARERGERPRRGGAEGTRAERGQAERGQAVRTRAERTRAERRRAERRQGAAPAQQARPEPAPEAQPAPLLPIAPAEPDDDAGEAADAADDAD
jgi:hypothetical protein